MVTESGLDLKKLAKDFLIEQMKPIDERDRSIMNRQCKKQSMMFEGKLQAKERPRKGAGGRFYTPKDTVEFEKKVALWGKRHFEAPVNYPLWVALTIYDETFDEELIDLAFYDLTHSTHGDVDNYAKAILDALNHVAWRDDKQINWLRVARTYDRVGGFKLTICRNGLTGAEYNTFCKYLKYFKEQV